MIGIEDIHVTGELNNYQLNVQCNLNEANNTNLFRRNTIQTNDPSLWLLKSIWLVHRSERGNQKMTNNNEDFTDFTIYNINPLEDCMEIQRFTKDLTSEYWGFSTILKFRSKITRYKDNYFRNKIQNDWLSLLFTPEVSINRLVHRIQGERLKWLTLSSSLLKSVLTDLYTESKERVWQWQLALRKRNTNIEDLFKSMDFTIFGVKSDKILKEIRKTWRISEQILQKYCNLVQFRIDLNWQFWDETPLTTWIRQWYRMVEKFRNKLKTD